MTRKTSVTLIVFGIINILVALLPPFVGCGGVSMMMQEPHMPIQGRDLGPALKKHIEKELPSAKWEAFGAVGCNSLTALLLIGGAVGLFCGQDWARWATIAAALLMILALCIHDVYQLALFQPTIWDFFDRELGRGGAPGEREGAMAGSTVYSFWSCANIVLIVYLFAMCVVTALVKASYEIVDVKERWLGAYDRSGDARSDRGKRDNDRGHGEGDGTRERDRG